MNTHPGEPSRWYLRFRGPFSALQEFARTWLQLGGRPLLEAAELVTGADEPGDHVALLIRVDAIPSNFLLGSLLEDERWAVLPERTGPDADSIRRPTQDDTDDEDARGGAYDGVVVDGFIVEGDRREPLPERYTCLFTRYSTEFAPPAELQQSIASRPGANGRVLHELPIALRPRLEHRSGDPVRVAAELEDRVGELQRQLEMHRYLYDVPAARSPLWMFPENGNLDRALRDWLFTLPSDVAGRYEHAFVELAEFGRVHLVRPVDPLESRSTAKPVAHFAFERDDRWGVLGYEVYTTGGEGLWPPPPADKPRVVRNMAACLWDVSPGADPGFLGVLVVHRSRSGVLRTVVPRAEFAPLDGTATRRLLNFRVAEKLTTATSARDATKRIRCDVERTLDEAVRESSDAIREQATLLEELWSDDRSRLTKWRDEVRALTEHVADLDRDAHAICANEWTGWEAFRDSVSAMDARLQMGRLDAALRRTREGLARNADEPRSAADRRHALAVLRELDVRVSTARGSWGELASEPATAELRQAVDAIRQRLAGAKQDDRAFATLCAQVQKTIRAAIGDIEALTAKQR